MKKIVDYTIVTNEYGVIKTLINEVKAKVADGWQPHGSLCTSGNTSLHQAMVKYELVIQPAPTAEPADTEADVNPAPTTPAP